MSLTFRDCGCCEFEDGAFVVCESCGYESCLDCHHIDSTPANVDDWKCKEGYGCNASDTDRPIAAMPFAMPFVCNAIRADGTHCKNLIESEDDLYATTGVHCGECFNERGGGEQ